MNTTKPSRRALYAALALTADLPMPRRVTFDEDRPDHVRMIFDSPADASVWATAFDAELRAWTRDEENHAAADLTFADCLVWVCGVEPIPTPEPPLAETTRTQFAAIAGGTQ